MGASSAASLTKLGQITQFFFKGLNFADKVTDVFDISGKIFSLGLKIATKPVKFIYNPATVKVLETTKGTLKWSKKISDVWIHYAPYFYKDYLFVADVKLTAYDKFTGIFLWESAKLTNTSVFNANMVAGKGTLYLSHNGNLEAYNAITGKRKWNIRHTTDNNYSDRKSPVLYTVSGKVIYPNY